MLTWLIENRLAAFETKYDYDMSYARELLATDRRAFMAFARAAKMSAYRRDVPAAVYYAVKLTGTIAEDCGPCTQLGVAMALADKIPAATLTRILGGDLGAMEPEVALGVSFARAVLAHAPEADPLREAIVARWGPRALISLAFAITMARVYPTLKYALGHGRACQRVVVDGHPVDVARSAA